MSKLGKVEKEALKALLTKHQKKHPGCKLNEKVCAYKESEDCIGKGDVSNFSKGSRCDMCRIVANHEYYERVVAKKRKKSKKRKVSFKKGTKKE